MRLEFTNLLERPDDDIRFMLDHSVLDKEVSEKLEISGWVIHRKHKIAEVFITSGREILTSSKLNIIRPKVREHFTKFHNSKSAGFKLVLPNLPKKSFHLNIRFKNTKTKPIAKLELVKCERRKLLFMHVPKAAGSSVNAFFARHYHENQYAVHIESNEKWHSSPDELKKLSFLSGHFNLYVASKRLNLKDYYKVTVVREPYAQLCPPPSWIKRLSTPGEELRLNQHTPHIQAFAKKLATMDLSNVAELKILLESLEEFEIRLVDNYQVRHFTWIPHAQTVKEVDVQNAIKASEIFDKIGITESIGDFMKAVAKDMKWPAPVNFSRENITQDFYGLDSSDAKTREILRPLVQYDMTLYRHIKALAAS